MKYLRQFCIILFVSFLGEILHFIIPLPVPASVYGLVLMLLALCTGILKPEQVDAAADFLIEIMPVMFLPAAVGLLEAWPSLQPVWLPVILITVITTVIVMAVTGRVTQHIIRRGNRRKILHKKRLKKHQRKAFDDILYRSRSKSNVETTTDEQKGTEKQMKNIPIDSLFFGAVISLAAYEGGLLLKKKFKLAIFNPLMIGTVCIMAVLSLLKIEYRHYMEGAKYISYLLTPATVCLAVPLYRQLGLLKQNLKAVAGGIASGVLASLLSVFLLAKLFGLNHEQYVTLLPKSITTAIGLGISEELGGITTITVAVIIVTGILGNIIAEFIYRIFHIEESVAKGLALGTASHAIGTARAMEMGEIEGAMSSLAIAVAGLVTVFGASVFANLI